MILKKKVSAREVAGKYDLLKREIGSYQSHITHILNSIDRKIERFKSKYEYYIKRNEKKFASIYHREIKNLLVIRRILYTLKMGLMAVNIRLDTMKIVVPALMRLKNSVEVIRDIVEDLSTIDNGFGEVYRMFIDAYLDFDSIVNIPDIDLARFLEVSSEDAMKIIKAVERRVGEELSKKLPNIPSNLDEVLADDPEKGVKKLYEYLVADGGSLINTVQDTSTKIRDGGRASYPPSILRLNIKSRWELRNARLEKHEEAVLRYIIYIKRGCFTYNDIYRVARVMRMSPEKVLDILYSLAEKGLISFLRVM